MKKLLSLLFILPAIAATCNNTVPTDSIKKYTDWLISQINIADSIDHPRQFWEQNVAMSLRARNEMPWGKNIPQREWLHFVLPVRVNNEALDSSRSVFYRELAPRIKNMTMEQAALEINHWAHEKATYRPSDSRTSSPLATVRTTFGRCGEESTLGVAAMRAAGIPARQVYTPRWAHTDDNHAWVEVWVDNKWRFLGACEPEPVLDLGWFNAPASQGMLMATNVIGNYDGPEQKLYRDSCYTRINITSNYTPTRKVSILVNDSLGNPVSKAPVSFRLYNYAEFYPLFSTQTDSNGKASIECGRGDLVAWATSPDGKLFHIAELYSKIPADSIITITLSRQALIEPIEMILTPPVSSPSLPAVTETMTNENNQRKIQEDSIRNSVMSRFLSFDDAANIATGWAADSATIATILVESYGNHEIMSRFVSSVPAEKRKQAKIWLEQLSQKDWRDITWPVISDFFINRPEPINPRIANELLTPWPSYFDKAVPDKLRKTLSQSPSMVENWINDNIAIDNAHNPNHFCLSPAGVWRSRKADTHSRNIFFVALCRWLGFDAVIDPVTSRVLARKTYGDEYSQFFNTTGTANNPTQATVKLTYPSDAIPGNPKYYIHFTISRIVNGQPELLSYPDEANWKNDFANGVELLPGQYILTTGRRLADGTVKARIAQFNIAEGEQYAEIPLVILDEPGEISIIGAFNADPLLPLTGRGTFIAAFVKPNHEPSAHFLNELAANREAFEAWGRPIVLIAPTEAEAKAIAKLPLLPSTVKTTIDPDGTWLKATAAEFEFTPDLTSLPVVLVADSFNRVMMRHNGYRPGIADNLIELIPRLPK